EAEFGEFGDDGGVFVVDAPQGGCQRFQYRTYAGVMGMGDRRQRREWHIGDRLGRLRDNRYVVRSQHQRSGDKARPLPGAYEPLSGSVAESSPADEGRGEVEESVVD